MAVLVVHRSKPSGPGDGNGHLSRIQHSIGRGLGMVRSQVP